MPQTPTSVLQLLLDSAEAGPMQVGRFDETDRRLGSALGIAVCSVILEGADSKELLLERLAEAMSFSDWFGANWDALVDCLGDWSARQGRAVLVVHGFTELATSDSGTLGTLIDIVSEQCRAADGDFNALFVGAPILDLPQLR